MRKSVPSFLILLALVSGFLLPGGRAERFTQPDKPNGRTTRTQSEIEYRQRFAP